MISDLGMKISFFDSFCHNSDLTGVRQQLGRKKALESALSSDSPSNFVVVEPMVTFTVSKAAYFECMHAFRAQQMENQIKFFEGMGLGMKKQVSGAHVLCLPKSI